MEQSTMLHCRCEGGGSGRRTVRALMGLAVVVASAAATLAPLRAETYPSRPVRIIVPYGAGGIADVTMRLVAQKLGERLGQQFIIDNRPGAGGVVGVRAVATAAPDGYTLSMIGGGLTISKSLFKSLPYDLVTDFMPISTTAFYGLVVAVKAGSPLKTVKDVIAAAKAKPGALNVGTINPGSTQHLSAELFKTLAGINVTMIPYKTTPELVTGVLRGEIDVAFEYQAALQGSLDDRQIVAVATTGREPASSLPQAPTVAASLPGYEVTSWNGLAAPAGTPTEIVTLLNKGVTEVLALPEIKAATAKFGMEARGSSSADLEARIKSDIDRWAKVIETAGIEKK
jgi:tripartite-type tricarboxylate transporter receptor subunit TctC